MSRRANPMAIKAALTYEVGEAAKALGKSPATIRNWIKDGLPVLASQKPYLIVGVELREYIIGKRRDTKAPLKPDELYCLSCRAGRKPIDMLVEAVPNNLKTLRLEGRCECCGAKATRFVSKDNAPSFAQTFQFKTSGTKDA
ncbi:helix-turn-helix domain-containing protein [Alphaproteobacteria bacterium KMM 3653]|uniref:Helix-turn-helix domain-containing protein n=1 Tax=Harenicola maris TaxID=2841044 RepID=A0AAP2CSY1_9RHOB|nr:helix-turn-helix domain-containing protein [Harenicola maris]